MSDSRIRVTWCPLEKKRRKKRKKERETEKKKEKNDSLLGILNANRKNPQAHGYRCSFHPGVFQSIDFPQGT